MDEDTKRALPLLFLLLFVNALLPIGMMLERLVPKQIWLEISPVLGFLLLPIAVFAVGALYMLEYGVISLRTCGIAITVSIVVILSLLFLPPWLVSRGLISLNAIKSSFIPIALISCLITILLVGAMGIRGGMGSGGISREAGRCKEIRPFFINKEAYRKGYSDAEKYFWVDLPPEIEMVEYVLFDTERKAYKLGWEDRKRDRPPEEP